MVETVHSQRAKVYGGVGEHQMWAPWRTEERLARVSHDHTPPPLPTCLFNDNLITATDFKSDKLKKKPHTHSARHRVEKFAFSGCLEKKFGALCRPVFVRTVFLDSPVQIIATQMGCASPVTVATRAVGFETERPTTNGGEYCGMLCCGLESPRASLCTRPPLSQSKGYCTL